MEYEKLYPILMKNVVWDYAESFLSIFELVAICDVRLLIYGVKFTHVDCLMKFGHKPPHLVLVNIGF